MPKIVYFITEDWAFLSHRLALARAARDVRLTNHLELARCCGAWLASAREGADA